MAAVRQLQRFPIAGLAQDRRPAFWEGDFHEVRDSGLRHAAYDIFVVGIPASGMRYKGAAIVAPLDGVVLQQHPRSSLPGAGVSDKGGNYVWIRGVDGYDYYFAHMGSRVLVTPGQRVVAGQQLGILGDSGNAHGRPHLHFAVKTPSGSSIEAYAALRAVEPSCHEPPIGGVASSGTSMSGAAKATIVIGAGIGTWLLWKAFFR
jgi:murein DD-endopeptidase MepM/ murein hydrolase activator NlpD